MLSLGKVRVGAGDTLVNDVVAEYAVYARLHFTAALGAVLDRFGKDVIVVADGPEHFTVVLNVVTSPKFYAWLFGFGTEVEILSPPSARLEMQNMLAAVADMYAPPRGQ